MGVVTGGSQTVMRVDRWKALPDCFSFLTYMISDKSDLVVTSLKLHGVGHTTSYNPFPGASVINYLLVINPKLFQKIPG